MRRHYHLVNFRERVDSADLTVTDTKIRLLPNQTVILSLNVLASKPENVAVLVGTIRFTKVHLLSLEAGYNNVEFRDISVYGDKGRVGRYFGQVRVLIINSEGNVSYDESIAKVDLPTIKCAFTLVITAVLLFYFACARFPSKKVAFLNSKVFPRG
jgi:hypothetical protein